MPAKYVRPYSKGQKNYFNDAEAIAEAVQRPTMKIVATKTAEQLDLQTLHRVRERLVSQRTGIINQIRAFMLERRIAVRQGIGFLRTELPTILATRTDALSPRTLRVIEEFAGDWRRLDQRIDGLSGEIEALARQDQACSRLMTVPGIGPIISSAMTGVKGEVTCRFTHVYPDRPAPYFSFHALLSLATKAKRPLNESGLEVGYMKLVAGRSDVTLVTDATAAFGSDGMKTTTSNAAMFTDAARSIDVAAPHSERLKHPSPSRIPTDQSRDAVCV
jgi:hypothetical protein